jgi:hypothetical protein
MTIEREQTTQGRFLFNQWTIKYVVLQRCGSPPTMGPVLNDLMRNEAGLCVSESPKFDSQFDSHAGGKQWKPADMAT